ncbi:hypothetical protein BCV69DRAFT_312410 [Microstroma glucosiphilum]|uniref:Uncharacterized protein n=1 Tax=Pseudomicrostroma glucosiphilum TaxID=1684307 RepID=A0A316UDL1_9BASI|nr:hypothetical protein BCV69DRAFT_312410 [Pseudomicrostroma glucosiphilum]PWN21155.1 hypothetical protein BCV69DRAFT_312410 [Pseudomicrostroma glucosiphilum]
MTSTPNQPDRVKGAEPNPRDDVLRLREDLTLLKDKYAEELDDVLQAKEILQAAKRNLEQQNQELHEANEEFFLENEQLRAERDEAKEALEALEGRTLTLEEAQTPGAQEENLSPLPLPHSDAGESPCRKRPRRTET